MSRQFSPSQIKHWFHKMKRKPYIIFKMASQEGEQFCEEVRKLRNGKTLSKRTYNLHA